MYLKDENSTDVEINNILKESISGTKFLINIKLITFSMSDKYNRYSFGSQMFTCIGVCMYVVTLYTSRGVCGNTLHI